MLNPKLQDALNKQINAELYSSYLYLSMAAHFESQNLKGHGPLDAGPGAGGAGPRVKFYDFVNERGGRVLLTRSTRRRPSGSRRWRPSRRRTSTSARSRGLINDLVNLAIEEKDHAASDFLQWFVNEQVEEEAAAT